MLFLSCQSKIMDLKSNLAILSSNCLLALINVMIIGSFTVMMIVIPQEFSLPCAFQFFP